MFFTTLQRKLKTFASLSWTERALFFEAYLRLGIARAAVLTLPFPWLSRHWGVPHLESLYSPHNDTARSFLRPLVWAIRTASRYTPWKSNCLAQAIAAKAMLRRRGFTSTLYLGMKTPSAHPQGKVEAHAWLRCGDTWICGFRASRDFTAVAAFTEARDAVGIKPSPLPDVEETLNQLK